MKIIKRAGNTLFTFLLANIHLLVCISLGYISIPVIIMIVTGVITLYVLSVIMPFVDLKDIQTKGIRRCQRGCENLYAFLASTALDVLVLVLILAGVINVKNWSYKDWTWNFTDWIQYVLIAVIVEACTFWVGIIRIYISSKQLGIKWRVIGILCGWIPVVHLIVLTKLIKIAGDEAAFENKKIIADRKRIADRMCETRYPILMVHGVFFRDFRYLNYWGRIPATLEANGARIYYGNHQSAASVIDSGKEIAERMRICGLSSG